MGFALMISRTWPLALTLLAACHNLNQREQGLVDAWLHCTECSDAELDSVAAVGQRKPPSTVSRLRADLLAGPSPNRRTNLRVQFDSIYSELAVFPTPLNISRADYVAHYVENFVAAYQSRAAIALVRIGTPAARAALFAALQGGTVVRNDVLEVLGEACHVQVRPYSQLPQAWLRDSLVPVSPAVLVRDSVTGTPLSNVRVVFAIDSGGGSVTDSVQTSDSSGVATIGGWRLGAAPGWNSLIVYVAGRALRFRIEGT